MRNDNKKLSAKTKSHYLYFKNGDAVEQVTRVLNARNITINSGPDAFIWDFLRKVYGSNVTVVSRSQREARATIDAIEARVFNQGKSYVGRILRAPLNFLRAVFLILYSKPTHVLCGTTGGMFWACNIAAWFLSIPLVYSAHNRLKLDNNRLHQRLSAIIDKWCIKRCRAVICHGPYLYDQLLRIGVDEKSLFEFDVGFSDMLSDSCAPLSEKYSSYISGYRVILFVGRIELNKGVFDLLSACSDRLISDRELRLIYAGTGSQINNMRMEIEKYGLNDQVYLLGSIPHQELGQLMQHCKMMVTPTHSEFPEGRCMAAMEGMVMGLPVIAPNFGPFPYIVKHESNGLLFNAGSVTELRSCINKLLDDIQLYNRIKAGAQKSGAEMVKPLLNFGAAVMLAFNKS